MSVCDDLHPLKTANLTVWIPLNKLRPELPIFIVLPLAVRNFEYAGLI